MESVDQNPVKPQITVTWEELKKKLLEISNIQIRPYTLKQIAQIYEVSPPTMRKMMAPHNPIIGMRDGAYYTIPQVRMIFKLIEKPTEHTNVTLASVYGVSLPTFREWVSRFKDELGETFGRSYNQRQLYIIVKHLDLPVMESEEQNELNVLLRLCA